MQTPWDRRPLNQPRCHIDRLRGPFGRGESGWPRGKAAQSSLAWCRCDSVAEEEEWWNSSGIRTAGILGTEPSSLPLNPGSVSSKRMNLSRCSHRLTGWRGAVQVYQAGSSPSAVPPQLAAAGWDGPAQRGQAFGTWGLKAGDHRASGGVSKEILAQSQRSSEKEDKPRNPAPPVRSSTAASLESDTCPVARTWVSVDRMSPSDEPSSPLRRRGSDGHSRSTYDDA